MELFGTVHYDLDGRIMLEIPEMADNGGVVPMTVESNVPVTEVAVIVNGNPKPLACHMELAEPVEGNFSLRIKMRKSSKVLALARDAAGDLHGSVRKVKVRTNGYGG